MVTFLIYKSSLCLFCGHFSWVNTWEYNSKWRIFKETADFPKWLYHFTFPSTVFDRSSCFITLLTPVIFHLFNFSYSSGCVVVNFYGFNWHFPKCKWCWTSFHVLIYHPYISHSEIYIQTFCQLGTGVVYILIEF